MEMKQDKVNQKKAFGDNEKDDGPREEIALLKNSIDVNNGQDDKGKEREKYLDSVGGLEEDAIHVYGEQIDGEEVQMTVEKIHLLSICIYHLSETVRAC